MRASRSVHLLPKRRSPKDSRLGVAALLLLACTATAWPWRTTVFLATSDRVASTSMGPLRVD